MVDPETIVTYAGLGLGSLAVTTASVVRVARMRDRRRERERAHLLMSAVYAVALMLWPIVLDTTLRGTARIKSAQVISGFPWMLLAYVWPVVLLAADLVLVRRRGSEDQEERRQSQVRNQGNILIGCAFATGTLLAVIRTRDSGYSSESARIILVSLIVCIAAIIPAPGGSESRSVASMTISALQKSALQYAIGFFILGILVAWKT